MAVRPLFDGLGLLPFSILFFVVVVLLTIRPSRLVDIIGKCLTPVLITGILILIVVGIANPIGPIGPAASSNIAQEGLLAGYQAMDILSVAGFAIIIQDSMVQSGLKTWKEQRPQVAGSTGVAALLLAVVYGGSPSWAPPPAPPLGTVWTRPPSLWPSPRSCWVRPEW